MILGRECPQTGAQPGRWFSQPAHHQHPLASGAAAKAPTGRTPPHAPPSGTPSRQSRARRRHQRQIKRSPRGHGRKRPPRPRPPSTETQPPVSLKSERSDDGPIRQRRDHHHPGSHGAARGRRPRVRHRPDDLRLLRGPGRRRGGRSRSELHLSARTSGPHPPPAPSRRHIPRRHRRDLPHLRRPARRAPPRKER